MNLIRFDSDTMLDTESGVRIVRGYDGVYGQVWEVRMPRLQGGYSLISDHTDYHVAHANAKLASEELIAAREWIHDKALEMDKRMNSQEITELRNEIETAAVRYANARIDEEKVSHLPMKDERYKKASNEAVRTFRLFIDATRKLDALAVNTSRNYPNRNFQIGNGNTQHNVSE
jgi:hypothetical protein